MKKLFIALFFLQTQLLNAQTKVILLDTLTFVTASPLPFDEPFYLGIPVKTTNISAVGYIQLKKDGTFSDQPPANPNIEVKKLGTQNYCYVKIEDPFLLNPGKKYLFFWSEGRDNTLIEAFDYYNDFKESNNKNSFEAAQKIISNIGKTTIGKKFLPEFSDTTLKKFDSKFYSDPRSNFPKKYKLFEQELEKYNQFMTQHAVINYDPIALNFYLKLLINKSSDFDSDLKTILFKDFKQSIFRLTRFINLSQDDYNGIRKGLISIDCDTCKPLKEIAFEERNKNIINSKTAIEELIANASALTNVYGITNVINSLRIIQDELTQCLIAINPVLKTRNDILNTINSIGISSLTTVETNTFNQSFETRTKLSISPDFGIVTTRPFKDESNPYAFAPYLGFHINFRPLNRDVRFSSYTHKPLSYFSAFIGWTLVNVSNGSTLSQNADSVTGFFTSDKGTLLTGIGIRLSNYTRLTVGTMYYFKFSKKDASTYDRNLRAWAFLGLSIDLALKDLLNNFPDVLSGAPKSYNPPVNSQ